MHGDVIMLTDKELHGSLNSPDAFILAVVQIEGAFARQPAYAKRFFQRELGFAETAAAFDVNQLLGTCAFPA